MDCRRFFYSVDRTRPRTLLEGGGGSVCTLVLRVYLPHPEGAEGTFVSTSPLKREERSRKGKGNKEKRGGFSLCGLAFHSNLQECLFLHQTFHRRERLSIHHIWEYNTCNYSTLRSHWSFSSVCLIINYLDWTFTIRLGLSELLLNIWYSK